MNCRKGCVTLNFTGVLAQVVGIPLQGTQRVYSPHHLLSGFFPCLHRLCLLCVEFVWASNCWQLTCNCHPAVLSVQLFEIFVCSCFPCVCHVRASNGQRRLPQAQGWLATTGLLGGGGNDGVGKVALFFDLTNCTNFNSFSKTPTI